MGLKSYLAKYYASFLVGRLRKAVAQPVQEQQKVLDHLIRSSQNTVFGKDHHFDQISDYESFKKQVPVRDYEQLRPYIDQILDGQSDVMWPGKPIYLCKTSGTTSGAKYIPISKESIHNHINSAKMALLCYVHETGNSQFVDGKMIFLQGSPTLEKKAGINFGRLSGIVAHHVPGYLQKNRLPSFETNSIEDWEEKVDAIVGETQTEDLRLISGIPSWVQMYFERLIKSTGKKSIAEVFPNFSLFVYGGVNFKPYESIFQKLIGRNVDLVETYPASEGFIAFQDSQKNEGLLLVINDGIFYEFIPTDEYFNDNPTRVSLKDVEVGVNYAIILNTNAGLWGYSIGDTVKFVSKSPYRLIVTGRIKHFTSAFGEHVIAEEVEGAMKHALENSDAIVREFHVAPQVSPASGLPFHQWFVEFEKEPSHPDQFADLLDKKLQEKNPYYLDLIQGNILRPLVVTSMKDRGFVEFMKSAGKLGGQNKVPRLSNDRSIADQLESYAL
ncbi:GH3 auxin-responsive promoter family protein [bacterium SCSIO 12741]|nr:GH3 auxin-responsive promoter family protein [bacterium SCSIO 12741]